ncbi:TPA: hypothetical protein ACIDKC_003543, partial [Shigella sonnei]|uniref:hypothetical protein n=4 Tax=Escherichia coli TaxID=562 RepID=UPI00195525BD
CRMRRKRLIRPTKQCKFNILQSSGRPDKHRASGKLTFVISINHRVTGGDGFLTSYRQKCIRH